MSEPLSVVGITQTVLFDDDHQYTQLILSNNSGSQVPIAITDEEAYLLINLAKGSLDEPEKQPAGSSISSEVEMGEQI
tara:strand:+ start:701 stop:934 length:234 start_codon:yes stop_codon:yes gene_type:complete